MTFTETQLMMMEDKPKYLSVDEKKIRKKCKKKISDAKNYQENKEEMKAKSRKYNQDNKYIYGISFHKQK